jgi:hypothetical protein
MLLKLAVYVPLWASCLLICFSLTLMLVVRIPELLTPQLRVVLLRICCYAGLVFLFCTAQWIYAFLLVGFMFDKFDHAYRRWLEEPTDKSVREAYRWLLLGGCLGVVEALDWLPAIFRPVMRVLSPPSTVHRTGRCDSRCGLLARGIRGENGRDSYWRCRKVVLWCAPYCTIESVGNCQHPSRNISAGWQPR